MNVDILYSSVLYLLNFPIKSSFIFITQALRAVNTFFAQFLNYSAISLFFSYFLLFTAFF